MLYGLYLEDIYESGFWYFYPHRTFVWFCPLTVAKTYFDAFLFNDSVVEIIIWHVNIICGANIESCLPSFYGIILMLINILSTIIMNLIYRWHKILVNDYVVHRFLRVCPQTRQKIWNFDIVEKCVIYYFWV